MSTEILYRNVSHLCRAKGVKISRLERNLKLQPGYFNQCANLDRKVWVQALEKVSAFFGYSMEEMWTKDIGREAEAAAIRQKIAEAERRLLELEAEK